MAAVATAEMSIGGLSCGGYDGLQLNYFVFSIGAVG